MWCFVSAFCSGTHARESQRDLETSTSYVSSLIDSEPLELQEEIKWVAVSIYAGTWAIIFIYMSDVVLLGAVETVCSWAGVKFLPLTACRL